MTSSDLIYLSMDIPAQENGQWKLLRACMDKQHKRYLVCGKEIRPVEQFPIIKDIDAVWQKYYAYVSDTGNDPLGVIAITSQNPEKAQSELRHKAVLAAEGNYQWI